VAVVAVVAVMAVVAVVGFLFSIRRNTFYFSV
jgi:Tfp pilus assembly protein FimT